MSTGSRACCAWLAVALFATEAGADAAAEESRLYELALERFLVGQSRVMRLADPIRVAGAPYCREEVAPVAGVFAADDRTFRDLVPREPDYKKAFAATAVRYFKLGAQPKILLVNPGSAAERAGLQIGDLVTRIDGKKIRRHDQLDVLRRRGESGSILLTVEREGSDREIELEAVPGCAFPSRFWFSGSVNAYATRFGRLTGMYVLGGMLDLLRSDDELALILGHELAHFILRHHGGPTTQRTEADADYLGIYLAARAGFDVAAAEELEDRMTRDNPYSSIQWGFYSHPSGPERAVLLRETLREIEEKQRAGDPLEPGRLDPDGEIHRELERPALEDPAVEQRIEATRAEGLARLREQQARVVEIAHRLKSGAGELCAEEQAPLLGAAIGRRRDFLFGREDEAEEIFGAVDEIRVFALAPGGPAERAGIRPGDLILAVNGSEIEKTQEVFDRLREGAGQAPTLRMRRGDEHMDVALPYTPGCRHGLIVLIGAAPDTVGHVNKEEILVPTGLVRYADDDELAIAIAHQIAHQLLGTPRPTDEDDEPPADRLGLYLAARAGYDISKAPSFWDRVAADFPWKISDDFGNSIAGRNLHAGMPKRAPALRASVREVQEKQAAGRPLAP